jgi:hypothetical protein
VTYAAYVNPAESLNCSAAQVVQDNVCTGAGVSLSGTPQVLSVSGMTLDAAGGAHASRTIKYMVTIN